jgi:hypothetical protein
MGRNSQDVYAVGEPIAALVATKNVGPATVRIADRAIENYEFTFTPASGELPATYGVLPAARRSGRDPNATTLSPGDVVMELVDLSVFQKFSPGRYAVTIRRAIYPAGPISEPLDVSHSISIADPASAAVTFEVR